VNKALIVSAAIALALSASAFAKGNSHSKSSARSAESAETMHFTEADCNTLSVASARNDCMRSMQARSGDRHDAVGRSDDRSGEGVVQSRQGGKHHKNKTKHRTNRNNGNADRG
jgi:hypothetical protein